MVQNTGSARFLLEPADARRITAEGSGKDLDCYLTPDPRITGAIDLSHSSGVDESDDFVLAEPRSGCQAQTRTYATAGSSVAAGGMTFMSSPCVIAAVPKPTNHA